MATINKTNALQLIDSVSKHIIDLVNLPGSTAAIVAGQGTTLGEIAALNDPSQQTALLDGFNSFIANENAYLNALASYNNILDLAFPAFRDTDVATGGLAAFITANQPMQVDPHYLDGHNRAVGKGALNPRALLAQWMSFGPVTPNLAQTNVTGSGVGTFVAGTPVASTYGNAVLSIFNARGSNVGGANVVCTVTYNAYNSSGVLVTGLTATATMPSGSIPNFAVALSGSAAGVAVTAISFTGGTNADQIGVKGTLLRIAGY